jgi:hypothetical protein
MTGLSLPDSMRPEEAREGNQFATDSGVRSDVPTETQSLAIHDESKRHIF